MRQVYLHKLFIVCNTLCVLFIVVLQKTMYKTKKTNENMLVPFVTCVYDTALRLHWVLFLTNVSCIYYLQ